MEHENNRQQSQSDAPPFSDALSNLLSNPEMMEKIRTIAEQLPSGIPSNDSGESAPPPPQPPSSADGLASVLANPQMMAMLPQIMAMLGPMLGANENGSASRKQEKTPEACRNDLLLALKPFLSPERCHAIDTMLRISKLGNVIRQIK